MSTNAPLKSIQDGLVFYFDTSNPKSYKGQPTVNLNSDPLALGGNPGSVSWGGYEYNITRTSDLPVSSMREISPFWLKCVCNGPSSGRAAVLGVSGLSTGVDYCISSYVYSDDADITSVAWNSHNSGISVDYSAVTYGSSDRSTVKRIYRIFRSVAGSQLEVLQTNGSVTAGDTFYITGIQCEQKSYPTQLVNGTRSNTNGLLDLTRRTTIDLTNTKFDSNALLDFPINASANSYATTNTNCNLTGDQTLTAWIKPTFGSSTPHRTVICTDKAYQYGIKLMNYKNYARWGLWLGWGSSNYEALTITDINDNKWKMITGTWKQSTGIVMLYLNGEYVTQFSTGNTNALSLSTGNIWVGMGYELDFGNGQSYEGKIDSAAIYNRTLSLDETRQLYFRTKSRYGL